jgi:hypothetical protein
LLYVVPVGGAGWPKANRSIGRLTDLRNKHYRESTLPTDDCLGRRSVQGRAASTRLAQFRKLRLSPSSCSGKKSVTALFIKGAKVTFLVINGYLICGYHLTIFILAHLCHTQKVLTKGWDRKQEKKFRSNPSGLLQQNRKIDERCCNTEPLFFVALGSSTRGNSRPKQKANTMNTSADREFPIRLRGTRAPQFFPADILYSWSRTVAANRAP